jgi:hypothetical protein
MLTGIVGYFTIPTVANRVISAGGMGAYNRNIQATAAKAGAAAGGVAGCVRCRILPPCRMAAAKRNRRRTIWFYWTASR